MSLIRRADIELMLKSKPYERPVAKNDFDITEYYISEDIAQKYKVNAKWVWAYATKTRAHPHGYALSLVNLVMCL